MVIEGVIHRVILMGTETRKRMGQADAILEIVL